MQNPTGIDNPGIGGGVYEKECANAKHECMADGVILLVFGGKRGNGFSVAAPRELCVNLPSILRSVADSIEISMKKAQQS